MLINCRCFAVAFFGAMMYGPRVHARQHLLVLPQDRRDAPMRYEKVQNFLEAIRKSQPAIFILLLSAMFLLTPFKFFALFIISLGGFHMVYDFVLYL
ncbi:hypothetical protein EB796_016543 [Bugula neritina]|uniref:Uncharacterized protein n=1 Tax=Bugula neritina TaxID=10212 RepID=A0A7J7JI34_BUGNE|nr:hypothetical protein EB796_016543 [Bugula neritina]